MADIRGVAGNSRNRDGHISISLDSYTSPDNSATLAHNSSQSSRHDNPAFDEDDLINVKWWDKEVIDFETIEKRILGFADQVERTKRSETVKGFGHNDTNDIAIVKGETGLLEEMSFRIDLREIDRSFIDNVLVIAKDLDCILLDRQGNLFEPTHENLSDNIKKSNAFKFVTNPTDFLKKLGKEIKME